MGVSLRRKTKMAAAVESVVNEHIGQNKIMIFSKTFCPFCVKAKNAFDEIGAEYTVLELDNRSDMNEIQDFLLGMTGVRTVPRVFIDGKCIGGGDETVALKEKGELQNLLMKRTSTRNELSALP